VKSGDFYDLIKNPHVLQSENEFWKSVFTNYMLYNRQHVYKNQLKGFEVESLFSLPSADVSYLIKDNPDYLDAKEVSDVLSAYLLNEGNVKPKILLPETVWTLQDGVMSIANKNFVNTENPLKPIEKSLGTLKIIADIKQELLSNHGAIGIISPDAKDASGQIPLLPIDKDDLQKEYRDYGLQKGKNKLIITNKSVKFTSISLKIAELLLDEFEKTETLTVANQLGFPSNLLIDDAKFSNKEAARKELYENLVIPVADLIQTSFNKEFELSDKGLMFEFDFSDISVLQSDEKEKAERNKVNTDAILSINNQVQDNKISRDSAIQILVQEYQMNEQNAELLISELQPKSE